MTTIVYRSGILAFDSLVTSGGGIVGQTSKGVKTDKYLAAAAGNLEDVAAFLQWAKDDFDPEIKNALGLNHGELNALIINKSGKVFTLDSKLFRMKIKAPYYALGSGSDYAMGAMEFGADAEEAAKVARKLDVYTGGRIRTLTFS